MTLNHVRNTHCAPNVDFSMGHVRYSELRIKKVRTVCAQGHEVNLKVLQV